MEDVHLAAAATRGTEQLYRDIRAACESGWDFSSRWFVEPQDMATIRTTEIVPVDLNVLLFKLESVLALACDLAGDNTRSAFYQQRATQRKQAIRDLFFDTERGFFDLVLPGCSTAKPSHWLACSRYFLRLRRQSRPVPLPASWKPIFSKPVAGLPP